MSVRGREFKRAPLNRECRRNAQPRAVPSGALRRTHVQFGASVRPGIEGWGLGMQLRHTTEPCTERDHEHDDAAKPGRWYLYIKTHMQIEYSSSPPAHYHELQSTKAYQSSFLLRLSLKTTYGREVATSVSHACVTRGTTRAMVTGG